MNVFGNLFDIGKTATTRNNSFIVTAGGYSANDIKRLLRKYNINSWDYQLLEEGIWFRVETGQAQQTEKVLNNHDISFI